MKRRIVFNVSLIFTFFLFIYSCAVTKEGKRIKKGSGVIQDSKILLRANWEGAVGFMDISIRENDFFDIREQAMFGWEYYAGTFKKSNDTLYLNFIDNHNPDWKEDYLIIEESNLLIPWKFEERQFMELQILYNSFN